MVACSLSRRWAPQITKFVLGTEDERVVKVMSTVTPDDVIMGLHPIDYTYAGPSCGVTLFISLVTLLTGRNVARSVAMTGEIGLR